MVQVDYSNNLEIVDKPAEQARGGWLGFEIGTKGYFEDHDSPAKTGKNSAGELFEDLLQREIGSIVVTYKKNIDPATWNAVQAAEYMSDEGTAINSDTIAIDGINIDAGQAKIAAFSAVQFKG